MENNNKIANVFGLIGFPLGHSFSKNTLPKKFEKFNLSDTHTYHLFELPTIEQFTPLLKNQPNLRGLNVTIPYKQAIIPFLDKLDESAQKVGAVNVIKMLADGTLVGYNSDYHGFKTSLEEFLSGTDSSLKALVLGNGGAGKAIIAALKDLKIGYKIVSRIKTEESISYEEVANFIADHQLIINCSPVGTFPKSDQCPAIPYEMLNDQHYLYDLVYNPVETLFLQKGKEQGAKTHNGLPMLHLQAEKAWEIWNA